MPIGQQSFKDKKYIITSQDKINFPGTEGKIVYFSKSQFCYKNKYLPDPESRKFVIFGVLFFFFYSLPIANTNHP